MIQKLKRYGDACWGSIFNRQQFLSYNIYILKMKIVAIALVILSLISLSHSLNWEYAGNWTTSNTSDIDTAINSQMTASNDAISTYGYNIGLFTKKLSNHLEVTLNWGSFWNVFVVFQDTSSDAVIYGYAFRGHWLWKNNIQFSGLSPPFTFPSGKHAGLIIWKDYNCQTKIYTDASNGTPFSTCTFSSAVITALSTAIKADTKPRTQADIWGTTYNIVEAVQAYSTTTDIGGANRAYSAVASQDKAAVFFGALCHASDGGYSFTGNLDFGTLFLFQTRDSAKTL